MPEEKKRSIRDLMRTHNERATRRAESAEARRKVFDDIETLMGHYASDLEMASGRAFVNRVDDHHVEMTIDLQHVPFKPQLEVYLNTHSVVFEYSACAAGSGPLLRRQGVNPVGAISETAMQ